jgi:hypothetical protein
VADLLGSAFDRYSETRGLDVTQLADHLGTSGDRLRELRLAYRPDPASPSFDEAIARAAVRGGCD